MTRQRRRGIIHRRRTTTGLCLVGAISFIAGMTDAVGLILSGNFVSFMTGNTTRAALAFADLNYRHAAILFVALWVFILGNALGIVVAHRVSSRRASAVLFCVSALLALAAVSPATAYWSAQFYLIVLSMGMINATVEHVEGLPIGLTYVTGALSRFGRGIGRFLVGDRNTAGWLIQCIPWTGMAAGAVTGAFLAHETGSDALFFVASLTLCLSLATLMLPRGLQLHFQQPIAHRRKPVPLRTNATRSRKDLA
ncbi:MAG: YoaK family protein [Neorhizobium sp.]|nr:YoaK family protein [Neorhizobium sp.]